MNILLRDPIGSFYLEYEPKTVLILIGNGHSEFLSSIGYLGMVGVEKCDDITRLNIFKNV